MRVVVSRTDRIGDVVLALPLCGLLRERLGAEVVFLASPYTRAVLEASSVVDDVIDWDEQADDASRRAVLARARAEVLLHVFPRRSIAHAAWRAGIPRRVGTSHRLYHWLYCTQRESYSRKRSTLHEAQLNLRLARGLLGDDALAMTPAELAPYARLRPRVAVPEAMSRLMAPDRFVLVVHPKSLGSAREWPLEHYRALIDALPPDRYQVLVTGSEAEGDAMRRWLDALPGHAHDVTGQSTLAELIAVLHAADGVVAGSTGPLHLAAALGTRTLGLFSAAPRLSPRRWSPLGPRVETVAAAPVAEAERDLGAISVASVAARVLDWGGGREIVASHVDHRPARSIDVPRELRAP
jgi:heptosyltransferase III